MIIAYLDTSALVKAYVQEAGTDQVLEQLHSADMAAAHEIAYVEARSAFARLFREGHLTQPEFDRVKAEFESDWPTNTIRSIAAFSLSLGACGKASARSL